MKFYKIVLSNRQEVVIDESDYQKVSLAMNTGSFVKLKKAIVNPSFIQCVLPIEQKEALKEEVSGATVEGYIDEKSKTFVVTSMTKVVPTELENEM